MVDYSYQNSKMVLKLIDIEKYTVKYLIAQFQKHQQVSILFQYFVKLNMNQKKKRVKNVALI